MTTTTPTSLTTDQHPIAAEYRTASATGPLRRLTGLKRTGHLHLGNLLGGDPPDHRRAA